MAARIQVEPVAGIETGNIAVASRETLFLLKGALLTKRVFTRDLYDLYVLIKHHGYQLIDLWKQLEAVGVPVDTVSYRMRRARLRSDDPGLVGLLDNPPSFEELQAFFVNALDDVEQKLAADAASEAKR